MAVEKQKVIARLKVLFPKANLSQKRLDAIADKLAKKPADDADETAIDAVINDFNDVMSLEEIAKEDDRIRTLEQKAKEQNPAPPTPPAPPAPPAQEPPKPTDDAPEYVKALFGKLEQVTADLETIKTGKITENKRQSAAKLLNESEVLKGLKPEIKEKWLNRIDVNSETPFEDQIKDLETEYSELVQLNADNTPFAGPAGSGSSNQKPDESVVSEIVDNLVN